MPDPETTAPARRVSMTVTGYQTGHLGGFYDLNSQPDGDGMAWSIPEFAVDEASVKDAPPEQLTDDDWSEIRGHVTGRLGAESGDRLMAQFRLLAAGLDGGWKAKPGHLLIEQFRQLQQWIADGEAQRMRRDAGISQTSGALLIGVSQAALHRWESGERKPQGRNAGAYFGFLSKLAETEAR